MERNFNVDRRFQIFCDKLTSNNVSRDLIIESSYNSIELSSNTIIFDGNVDLSMVTTNHINISNISEIVTTFLRVNTITLPSNVEITYNSVNDGYIKNTHVGYNPQDGSIGRSHAYFTHINVSGGDSSFNNSLYINKNLIVDGTLTISNDLLLNGANFTSIETSFNLYKYALEQNFYSAKILTKDVSALNISISNELVVHKTTYLNDLTLSGQLLNSVLKVPSIFTIDPSGHGNASGTLIINGDLTVQGNETTFSSSNVEIQTAAITLASNLANIQDLSNTNAGLDISNIASLKYNGTLWNFSGGQLSVGNNNVLFTDDISLAKRSFDLSINAYKTDFSSSFFTLKRNIDNSYNATYTRNQIDNSFILRANVDLSLTYLQSYANSSYISKNQLTISFDTIRTLMDVSYVSRNNKVIPEQPQYDYSTSTITPFGQNISGETTFNYFGYSVALSEDGTIMGVTAPANNGTGTVQGSSRIYKYNDVSWVQLGQDIDGIEDNGYQTIIKMSSDGTIAAISSHYNLVRRGRVRIFKYTNDTSWVQQGLDINGETAEDEFGFSISLSGNGKIIAIGAPKNDTSYNEAGQVRVYSYIENTNSWNIIGTFTGFELDARTGRSVSLSSSGTILAISSPFPHNNDNPALMPRVDIYEFINNVWTPKGPTIYGSYSGFNSKFGTEIVLSSNGLVLAINELYDPSNNNLGRVLVYNYNSTDNSWNKLDSTINIVVDSSNLTWKDPYIALSSDGTIMALGMAHSNSTNRGLVRLYKLINNEWIKVGPDILSDASEGLFGYALALSGDGSIMAIGSPEEGPDLTGFVRTYSINYAYTLTYTNPIILPNEIQSSFNSFTEKLDISYLLNSVFEASHNNIKTRFDISFATINLTNLEASSIIIETINTKHETQRFDNSLWNIIGQDISISNPIVLNGISNNGRVIAISNHNDSYDRGRLYVYEISFNGTSYSWEVLGISSEIMVGQTTNTLFGGDGNSPISLSTDGRIVAISETLNDTCGNDTGQVRVFELSANIWIQRGEPINGKPIDSYSLGYNVALSGNGNILAASSRLNNGEVLVYELSANANSWIQMGQDITGVDYAQQGFSMSLSLDGTTLAVGPYLSVTPYVKILKFDSTNRTWSLSSIINGTSIDPRFGWNIKLSSDGNVIVIGGIGTNPTSGPTTYTDQGSVSVYKSSNEDIIWNPVVGSTTIFSTRGYRLAWNGTIWVALGDGINSIAYSSDGNIWSAVEDSANLFTYGGYVAWNGTIWVAVGYGTHTIVYSTDGITWTPVVDSTNIFSVQGYRLAWNGTLWVAVGSGTNSIAYSTDGITWNTDVDTSQIFSNEGFDVAWNGTLWVAVGYGTNSIAYSYDGITWYPVENSTELFSYYGLVVAWNGTLWVALGYGGYGTNSIAYSWDGITWLAITWIVVENSADQFSFGGYKLAWNGTLWVAVGYGTHTIAYSPDGITWTPVKNSIEIFSTRGYRLAWNGTYWIAVGTGINSIAYSYDGITWAPVVDSTTLFLDEGYDVAWNGTYWVIVGTGIYTIVYFSGFTPWSQLGQTIYGESDNDKIGQWVQISNDGTIISAGGTNSYVKVYKLYSNTWTQIGQVLDGSGIAPDLGTYVHALSGDGTTLFQIINKSDGNMSRVYGMNKPLAFVPSNTTINTTISGDLAVTGRTILKSFSISNNHNFDVSINGYSSHYLASSDISASIVDYYSNVGSIYNKVFKIDAYGNVTNYSNVYGTISDSRLKENIVTSSPKLEDMLKVRVVNYNLKGSDKTKYIGVLAQELEELFPELVTDDSTGERFKSVNYSSLTILLIKAFQEQQVLINNLNATLEELEK